MLGGWAPANHALRQHPRPDPPSGRPGRRRWI